MASSSTTSCLILLPLLFLVLTTLSESKEILVGGKTGAWKVPSSQADSLNHWAETSRFRVGDHLVWKYDGAKDSVYQVTKEGYISCNTTNPIEQHKDGETKVELTRPGPFYFISGVKSNCEKGEKMIVVVLTPRHRFDISPAPSPAEFDGPAVAPTSGGSSLSYGLVLGLLGALVLGMF